MSRVIPCGRTDRETDMTQPTVAFRNLAKALQNLMHLDTLQYEKFFEINRVANPTYCDIAHAP